MLDYFGYLRPGRRDMYRRAHMDAQSNPTPMQPLPVYRCHKKVCALKIAGIAMEALPRFKGATCKGSIALGTACGTCEHCEWEKQHGPKMGAVIIPQDPLYENFSVSGDYIAKHKPEVGGYWVQYADGYQSFSPAQAFEEGYTRI